MKPLSKSIFFMLLAVLLTIIALAGIEKRGETPFSVSRETTEKRSSSLSVSNDTYLFISNDVKPILVVSAFTTEGFHRVKGTSLQEVLQEILEDGREIVTLAISTEQGHALLDEDFAHLRQAIGPSLVSVDLTAAVLSGGRILDRAFESSPQIWDNPPAPVMSDVEKRYLELLRQYGLTEEAKPAQNTQNQPLTGLVEILLPEGTEKIGERAFANCFALREISAPTATEVGKRAFEGCRALASVDLPSAKTVGDFAFQECRALITVNLPSAREIGAYAFSSCSALYALDLPLAEKAGVSSFSHCAALRQLSAPNLLMADHRAFEHSGLRSVELPNVRKIGAECFADCPSLERVSLPRAVEVGARAFAYNKALLSVDIPLIEFLPDMLFSGCINLKSVHAENAAAVRDSAFSSCSGLQFVSLPSAKNVGRMAFSGCVELEILFLPRATRLGEMSLLGCGSLQTLVFGRDAPPLLLAQVFARTSSNLTVYTQDGGALPPYYPPALHSGSYAELAATGHIPSEILREIAEQLRSEEDREDNSLYDWTPAMATRPETPHGFGVALLLVGETKSRRGSGQTLPEAVESAAGCGSKIRAISVATGVSQDMTNEDFRFLRLNVADSEANLVAIDLSKVRLEGKRLPEMSFFNMRSDDVLNEGFHIPPFSVDLSAAGRLDNLSLILLPEQHPVLEIEADAFAGCGNLRTVGNLDSVWMIATRAFMYTGFISIELPSVEILSARAFSKCPALREVYLPHVIQLDFGALRNCSSLWKVALPRVLEIKDSAFLKCHNLREINLPNLERVGVNAFSGCTSLVEVALPKAKTLYPGAFRFCSQLKTISLPEAEEIGELAFGGCTSLESFGAPRVRKIGKNAFFQCQQLKSLVLPEIEYLGERALAGISLQSIHLPKVLKIGNLALPDVPLLELPNIAEYDSLSIHKALFLPQATTISGNSISSTTTSLVAPLLQKDQAWAIEQISHLNNLLLGDTLPSISMNISQNARFEDAQLKVFTTSTDLLAPGDPPGITIVRYSDRPAPAVALSLPATRLKVGECLQAAVVSADASVAAISELRYWSTDRPDVVSLEQDGTITGQAPGRAGIWCIVSTDVHIGDDVFESWPVSAMIGVEVQSP